MKYNWHMKSECNKIENQTLNTIFLVAAPVVVFTQMRYFFLFDACDCVHFAAYIWMTVARKRKQYENI